MLGAVRRLVLTDGVSVLLMAGAFCRGGCLQLLLDLSVDEAWSCWKKKSVLRTGLV